MISVENFIASRDDARAQLDTETARASFGYWIDFANAWETYRSPREMLFYLGIHQINAVNHREMLSDLGRFSATEVDWARRYLEVIDRVGRLLSTTAHRPELQFDIAETAVDWRMIRQMVDQPARILDYGAGCGRHGVSAMLHHTDSIYAAIDSTLAMYTVQNLVLSFISSLRERRVFRDFLDCQLAGEAYPDIARAAPGSLFHVPAWFEHSVLPERYFDLMIACHVHTELSRPDFLRLVAVADRCLADEGVLYIRSELAIPFPKGYFEALDLHGMDSVAVLRERGFVPVYCAYQCVYQTTFFARIGSSRHARARASSAPECQFLDLTHALETTVLAGRQWAHRRLEAIVQSGARVVFAGRGFGIFDEMVTPYMDRVTQKLVLDLTADPATPETTARIRALQPDVVVAASPDFVALAAAVRETAGGEFALTVHRVVPMSFSYRTPPGDPEPGLARPVLSAGDFDRNRGEPPRTYMPDGGGLLAAGRSAGAGAVAAS